MDIKNSLDVVQTLYLHCNIIVQQMLLFIAVFVNLENVLLSISVYYKSETWRLLYCDCLYGSGNFLEVVFRWLAYFVETVMRGFVRG